MPLLPISTMANSWFSELGFHGGSFFFKFWRVIKLSMMQVG